MSPARALAPILALLAIACGPSWTVVRRSGPPSALAGATEIGVAFDWSAVAIEGRPEAEWLEGRSEDQRRSYLLVRTAIMETFLSELATALEPDHVRALASTGAEPVQLVLRPTGLDLGTFAYMSSRDSRLDSALVWSTGGAETDHITIRTSAGANALNADALGRMTLCARRSARIAAEYLRRASQ